MSLSSYSPRERSRAKSYRGWALIIGILVLAAGAYPQRIDDAYTKKIREYTTDPHFSTKYVDYLPAAPGIPTPLQVLGHIVGAPDILSTSQDVYRYFDALAKASPRIKVLRMEKTEEGRDWILALIGDAASLRDIERHKKILGRLADPRGLSEAEARSLIRQAKPIYWATGGMHSSETGSVEMLMELAYRLVADESPFIRTIRDNAIVMITPILEPDGRDKYVDVAMAPRKDPQTTITRRLLYWGKYVSHDNNRDNIGLALALSRNIMKVALTFHPQVMHDLHESASHLYISTGSGPYNAWLDPIVIDEWHEMAYHEVAGMTREGVPGVWTHAFYDGWAPNYAFYAANGHNAIGRFYETQGAGDAATRVIGAVPDRAWYKPNPPVAQALWSIRNNVNLQQSALLMGLNHVAVNKERFLENFWLKSKRSVDKAQNEGPAAYIFPGDDPRPGLAARLLRLLQAQGVEVHKVDKSFKVGAAEYPAGSAVVRMDQPYSRMADMLLDRQYYNVNDPRPYDDVGWTLGPLFNVRTVRVNDAAVLSAPMTLVTGPFQTAGGVARPAAGSVQAYLLNHDADNALATFRFGHKNLKIQAAEKPFECGGRKFNAGSFIIKVADNPGLSETALDAAGRELGLRILAGPLPDVPAHELPVPRVAVMHTWQNTQNEGWVRIALDEIKVLYEYISVHTVRDTVRLRDRYDVILFGPSMGDALGIVAGIEGDKPQAWKKTPITPNLGSEDSTEDMRGGLELDGILHLRDFVRDGGLLITLTNSSAVPLQFGLARGLSIRTTQNLWAQGSVFQAKVIDSSHPITYGFDGSLGVYFSQGPVFRFGGGGIPYGGGMRPGPASSGRPSGRGSLDDPDIPQGRPRDIGLKSVEEFRKKQQENPPAALAAGTAGSRPRTVMSFTSDLKELLISGGLAGGEELAGAPALIDAPLGAGHIVMFSFNPMWRHQTQGAYALVWNAMLNFKSLTPAPPPPPPAPVK